MQSKTAEFLILVELFDDARKYIRPIWWQPPYSMCPIPQTYSPEYPLDMFFTDSIPIPSSFTDLIKFLISLLITIPFSYLDLTLNLTLSDSNSWPHEPSSNLTKDQFISIPWQLLYSSEEILLPICLTLFTDLVSDFISDHVLINCNHNPIPIYISAKKKYKPVYLKFKPVIGELPDKFRIIRDIIGDPLKDLLIFPINHPEFKATRCYTKEWRDKFDEAHPGFLWLPK